MFIEPMIHLLTTFFLRFSHWVVIVPCIVLGYCLISRRIFCHALCLLALGILLNIVLKNMFQIPLSPALGKEGFAFPSGHMHVATVLYGWLALNIKNRWFRLCMVIILLGVGFSLVHAGYHNYYDVFGGLFFGTLLVLLYHVLLLKIYKQRF